MVDGRARREADVHPPPTDHQQKMLATRLSRAVVNSQMKRYVSTAAHKIVIVGAGTAGLTVATQLQRAFAAERRPLAADDIALVDPAKLHHCKNPSIFILGASEAVSEVEIDLEEERGGIIGFGDARKLTASLLPFVFLDQPGWTLVYVLAHLHPFEWYSHRALRPS